MEGSELGPTLPQSAAVAGKDSAAAISRWYYVVTALLGCPVKLQLKPSSTQPSLWEGVLHAVTLDPSFVVVLRACTSGDSASALVGECAFHGRDILELTVQHVPANLALEGAANQAAGFKTDTGISGSGGRSSARELVAWGDAELEEEASGYTGSGLLDPGSGGGRKDQWDQFAVNEKLFGLQTDFDEDMYTTKLDKSGSAYKKYEREADRLAGEIERGANLAGNAHMQEERGTASAFDGDEEDRYAGVLRSVNDGKYVPPGLVQKAKEFEAAAKDKTGGSATKHSGGKRASPQAAATAAAGAGGSPSVPLPHTLAAKDHREYQAKETGAIQTLRREAGRSDKIAAVADLKNFSMNFKLPVAAQAEQAKLARTESKSSLRSVDSVDGFKAQSPEMRQPLAKADDTQRARSRDTPSNETAASPKATTALNPDATEFKFNIAAAEFNPGSTSFASGGGSNVQQYAPQSHHGQRPSNNGYRPRPRGPPKGSEHDPNAGYAPYMAQGRNGAERSLGYYPPPQYQYAMIPQGYQNAAPQYGAYGYMPAPQGVYDPAAMMQGRTYYQGPAVFYPPPYTGGGEAADGVGDAGAPPPEDNSQQPEKK